jgi:hypothetical protein
VEKVQGGGNGALPASAGDVPEAHPAEARGSASGT